MRVPKYRCHPNGQAFVEHRSVQAKSHRLYLGKYGSPESHRRYQQFLRRLSRGAAAASPEVRGYDRTISELLVLYLEYAERHYSHDGHPTGEFSYIKYALRILDELYGDESGQDFSPSLLISIQERLVGDGYAVETINGRIGRIKRFFRWCCKRELLPGYIYPNLTSIDQVSYGRDGFGPRQPVPAVTWENVMKTVPYFSPTVATMIQVQYLCGMRPSEVTIMRPCDMERSGDVWLYSPRQHKGSHLEQVLIKAIPKAAQVLLAPFMNRDPEAFLFSPKESEAWRREHRPYRKEQRKTPIYPSEMRARAARKQARQQQFRSRKRDCYDRVTYRQAVQYGIAAARRAGVEIPDWSPNQLRHGIATEISKTAGLGQQAAQRWLGHANLKTTGIYVEKQVGELIEIARHLDRHWAS